MCNFKIGQEVVCIDAKPTSSNVVGPPLVLNKIYTIKGIRQKSCCGNVILVDVGLCFPRAFGAQQCSVCGTIETVNSAEWYVSSSRFAPLQTQSEEADMNEAWQEVFERELFQV